MQYTAGTIVPRVSYHTAPFTVRYVPVPGAGTVSAGTGAVWENPTRGLPVLNPTAGSGYASGRYGLVDVGIGIRG